MATFCPRSKDNTVNRHCLLKMSSKNKYGFQKLPIAIKTLILRQVDTPSKAKELRLVCKEWDDIINDLWFLAFNKYELSDATWSCFRRVHYENYFESIKVENLMALCEIQDIIDLNVKKMQFNLDTMSYINALLLLRCSQSQLSNLRLELNFDLNHWIFIVQNEWQLVALPELVELEVCDKWAMFHYNSDHMYARLNTRCAFLGNILCLSIPSLTEIRWIMEFGDCYFSSFLQLKPFFHEILKLWNMKQPTLKKIVLDISRKKKFIHIQVLTSREMILEKRNEYKSELIRSQEVEQEELSRKFGIPVILVHEYFWNRPFNDQSDKIITVRSTRLSKSILAMLMEIARDFQIQGARPDLATANWSNNYPNPVSYKSSSLSLPSTEIAVAKRGLDPNSAEFYPSASKFPATPV